MISTGTFGVATPREVFERTTCAPPHVHLCGSPAALLTWQSFKADNVYIYIYICLYIEREMFVDEFIYIYIYICMYICIIYIYIYMYTHVCVYI